MRSRVLYYKGSDAINNFPAYETKENMYIYMKKVCYIEI